MRAIVSSSDGGRTPRLGRVKVKVSKIIIAGNRIQLAEMPNLVIIGAKLPLSELWKKSMVFGQNTSRLDFGKIQSTLTQY